MTLPEQPRLATEDAAMYKLKAGYRVTGSQR
jgi:hypothetical protein